MVTQRGTLLGQHGSEVGFFLDARRSRPGDTPMERCYLGFEAVIGRVMYSHVWWSRVAARGLVSGYIQH
jgi:hypothetical protein